MDLKNNQSDSDESLSEDSLEVSDIGSTRVRSETSPNIKSPDKISCALCVSRNRGNSMETVRSFAKDSQGKI